VQGKRTCGIDHRPSEGWLERLDRACDIKSPGRMGSIQSESSRPCAGAR
jgi:hypothetical protein